MRGHGKSQGLRRFIDNKKTLLDDIDKFIEACDKLYTNKKTPRFIMGFSLGAALANLIAIKRKNYFRGMILLAPPFQERIKQKNSSIKDSSLWKSFPIFNTLGKGQLKVGKMLKSSPKLEISENTSVGTVETISDVISENIFSISSITTPYFMIHGQQDFINPYQGSVNFHKISGVTDKTFFLVGGTHLSNLDMKHDIRSDFWFDRYLGDIGFWMVLRS